MASGVVRGREGAWPGFTESESVHRVDTEGALVEWASF
jgi:hypothetical protein